VDGVTRLAAKYVDEVVRVPFGIDLQQRLLSTPENTMDILLFPECLDQFSYYVAHARLAPVQAMYMTSHAYFPECVHDIATGSIDYFLTSESAIFFGTRTGSTNNPPLPLSLRSSSGETRNSITLINPP
jgi:hypothetical protein